MFLKYLNAFFENRIYLNEGLAELSAPIERLIYTIFHSTIFRVLYFIPFAVLKVISITFEWYYENFINNELMLESAANRVVFVYLIPAGIIIGLFVLLSRKNNLGWMIVSAIPIIFIFFPICAVLFVSWVFSKIQDAGKDSIYEKRHKLKFFPPKEIKYIQNPELQQKLIRNKILNYALGKTKGYKRILTNLSIPINGNYDENIKVDSIVINKHGVAIWNIKDYSTPYIYGDKEADNWYKADGPYLIHVVRKQLKENGVVQDSRIQRIKNPVKQNRKQVNSIQKMLRLNGLPNAHMFSGVAFFEIYESDCDIESGPDEKACDVQRVPLMMKLWKRMAKIKISKKDVDLIAGFLSQYETVPEITGSIDKKRLQGKHSDNPTLQITARQTNL